MFSQFAFVFGLFFLAIGVLGFVPAAAPGGMLFGYLHVNELHNLIHIGTGVFALLAAYWKNYPVYFQIFGIVYLVIAALGLYYGDAPIFGLIANNFGDVIFHFVVSLVSLYYGFFYANESMKVT